MRNFALVVDIATLGAICGAAWWIARQSTRSEENTKDLKELSSIVASLSAIVTTHETHKVLTEERLKEIHRRIRRLERAPDPDVLETPT